MLGTLIGCLIMSVLNNGCVHAQIPNAWQDIIIGAIIVAAVTLDRFRRAEAISGRSSERPGSWPVGIDMASKRSSAMENPR